MVAILEKAVQEERQREEERREELINMMREDLELEPAKQVGLPLHLSRSWPTCRCATGRRSGRCGGGAPPGRRSSSRRGWRRS